MVGRACQAGGLTQESIARPAGSAWDDIEPVIWRTIDMPVAGSLKMLHDVIQAAMGWQDYHLCHFDAADRRYGLPNSEWPEHNLAAARNIKLGALIDRGVHQLTYTYDMGDDWRHTVVVGAARPAEPDTKYPRFVAGERRCPPEEVGGFPGFELFLDAMSDPSHEEHERLREWHGGTFEPEDIDKLASKRAVAAIAIRRHASKAA